MKATIQGIEVEGTPEEINKLISLLDEPDLHQSILNVQKAILNSYPN